MLDQLKPLSQPVAAGTRRVVGWHFADCLFDMETACIDLLVLIQIQMNLRNTIVDQ